MDRLDRSHGPKGAVLNISRKFFIGMIVSTVLLLSTAGVALTADHSRAGAGAAHGGYLVDDKDDDTEDVARDHSVACAITGEPGCQQH